MTIPSSITHLDDAHLDGTHLDGTPSDSAGFAAELIEFIEADVATYDDPIEPDTDLLLTGLVDSLGVVMVSAWIQERLSITIDPGDIVLENFQTVAQMVAYVASRGAVHVA